MGRVTYEHLILVRKPEADVPEVSGQLSITWSQALLSELGVSVYTSGAEALEEPGLLVSNHAGILDILVWLSTTPCCFLAKDVVRHTPMVGEGATRLGTVWLRRDSTDSRSAAREAIARAISEESRRVVVFPEGTTSRGGLPWRYGSFKVAQEQGLWVQAAALRYANPRRTAWVEEFFPAHFWELLAAEREEVELHRFEPVKIRDLSTDVPRIQAQVNAWLGRDGSTRPPG
jgi:1-acyl-sn-glycerol-3-phosphate acyltransferase